MEQKKKKIMKRKNILIAGVLLVVLLFGYFLLRNKKAEKSNTITISRGDVIEEVSVTGKVVPTRSIDLAFEKGGRISRFPAVVGKKVSKGEILAQIENSDLYAQIAQAEATLKTQQAKLDELKKGARPEEIAIKQTQLKKAEQDLESYYQSVPDVLNDAYAKVDDAVRSKVDDMFSDDDTTTPKLTFTTSNTQAEIDVLTMRYQLGVSLTKWRAEIKSLSALSTKNELSDALKSGETYLSLARDFFTRMLDVVDGATGISATTVSTYKANINIARTNINTSFTALTAKEQTIGSQKLAIEQIRNELSLTLSGATREQITAQEAQVDQAQANLLYYQTQYEKTLLRAPFSGTITKTNVEVGDIVSPGTSVISLIGSGNFEIEAYVAESDIAKIKLGDSAQVTLDAYGKGVIFQAKVTQIDLSETIIDGVATYKTKLQFDQNDGRILPGLTADVNIRTGEKKNVIFVPTRNIIIDGGKYFVNKILGNTTEKVEITIGLKGSDGRTEVLSGLQEGDVLRTE